MYTFTISLSLLVIFPHLICASKDRISEDATLDSAGLATKYGHPPTQYTVITEDGYILTVYRLPGRSRIPILLAHGICDSSDTWLIRGYTSLAITLANKGYDIWLANFRGNRYSRVHKTLNPDKDPEFWHFSFHEMGLYDLPAVIDTVLNVTGVQKLSAIGHSQGNTIFYVLGSERAEYNSKINVLIALAPIAYLHHILPPLANVMHQSPFMGELVNKLGINEIFGDNSTSARLLHKFCTSSKYIVSSVCLDGILFPLMGYDRAEVEPDFALDFAAHFPAGSSVRCILHFFQVGYRKIFARYDYGSKENRRVYNAPVPPVYRLEKVTMPIALLAARNDHLSTTTDVAILKNQLPNVVYYLENPRSLFNHADYMIGRNMPVYLYPYLFRVLHENNNFVD